MLDVLQAELSARIPWMRLVVFRGKLVSFNRTVNLHRASRVVIGVHIPNVVFCGVGTAVLHLSDSLSAADRCVRLASSQWLPLRF